MILLLFPAKTQRTQRGYLLVTQLTSQTLYEQDYYLWLETILQQLQELEKNRDPAALNGLDWEHLLEEIEALGSEQRRKSESYLRQLLIHLLLYKYWESERSYCGNGWKLEIRNFRDELEFLLRSKTLFNYLLSQFDRIYKKARQGVIDKTGFPANIFPIECPFSFEQVLDFGYLPE